MPNYLVLGLPKMGTSAVHAAIKKACNPLSLFEPTNARQVAYLERREAPNKLAKVMMPALADLNVPPGFFDRTVLVVRDPRDVLVSWLLYRPLLARNCMNGPFVQEFLVELERKEAAPRDVSLVKLFSVLDRHGVAYTRERDFAEHFRLVMDFDATDHAHFMIRYEDYVDGRVSDLEAYLGLPVQTRSRVSEHIAFNERSKSYGGWKSWFTPEDCERWRSTFQPFIERYGYESAWTLSDAPAIDPTVSSGYVRRNLARLERVPNQYGSLKEHAVYTEEYLRVLRAAMADGAEAAIVELSLAHKYGFGAGRSDQKSLTLLRDAVERGNPLAMVHLGIRYERGDGVLQDIDRAKELFSTAGAIYGNRRTKRTIARFRQIYPVDGEPIVGSEG